MKKLKFMLLILISIFCLNSCLLTTAAAGTYLLGTMGTYYCAEYGCTRDRTEKDVDGFSNVNVGKMVIGDESGFLSCTPYGIMQLLEGYDIDVDGKDVVVVGRSNIVGKPMAMMLIQKGATVQVCNSRTKDLSKKLKKADIIVVAVGVPRMIKATDVKEGVVVIDVGINRVDGKLCGDVDYEDVAQKASYITPVPGGVGPMTIASLIKNTFISYQRKIY